MINAPSSQLQKTDFKHKRMASLLCTICGDFARGKNFGVISCLACAAFFRSSVVQNRNYTCKREKKCEIDKKSRVGCRACRLKKCFQIGMQKDLVQMASAKKLSEDMGQPRQSTTAPNKILKLANTEQAKAFQELVQIEARARRIRESGTSLPDAYFDQFTTMEQLLSTNINLLNRADQFSTNPPLPWDFSAFMTRVKQGGIYAERPKHRILDHFLIVDMAKAMPAFKQLSLQDRINLIKYINLPIMTFVNAHYSAQHNSETVMAPNGQTPISGFLSQRYSSDLRVARMSERMYCEILEPHKEFGLTHGEYVLLLAIFNSHHAAPNLSTHAIQLLYHESVRYSQILLYLLQSRLGPLTGANRYSEALQFINHAIQGNEFYKKF